MFCKKRRKKKKGEFIEQRKINKRRATIYDKINLACKEANEKGYSVVEVDNRRFYLASYENVGNSFYLSYYGFLRLKKFGLVFCQISEKDGGWQQAILPAFGGFNLSHTTVSKRLAACVLRVVDIKTGEDLFFEPEQSYFQFETENSWWVKLRNKTKLQEQVNE